MIYVFYKLIVLVQATMIHEHHGKLFQKSIGETRWHGILSYPCRFLSYHQAFDLSSCPSNIDTWTPWQAFSEKYWWDTVAWDFILSVSFSELSSSLNCFIMAMFKLFEEIFKKGNKLLSNNSIFRKPNLIIRTQLKLIFRMFIASRLEP